jgi:hypothetical protein
MFAINKGLKHRHAYKFGFGCFSSALPGIKFAKSFKVSLLKEIFKSKVDK